MTTPQPPPPEIILPTGRPAFLMRSGRYAEHPPWSILSRRSRQELYRIGTAQGQSHYQVRRAYAAGEPLGTTQYQQRQARGIISGRIRPGRSYQQYAPRTRKRIDRLIEQRQNTEGVSRRQALRDIQEGRWRPTAQKEYQRIPQNVRAQTANQGYDASQDSPALRYKRDQAIAEAQNFVAREHAEGNFKANGQTLTARLSMATEQQLDMWLTADDAGRKALAMAQPDAEMDTRTLRTGQRVNPVTGEVEYYHPITGGRTDYSYVHDNFAWYH